jgi:predicted Fe-S protein YdhL (DUF1289 family)
MPAEAVPSPCNSICEMDVRSGACLGCGRTLGEIAEWGTAPTARQRAIVRDAAARLTAMGRSQPLF